MEVLDKWSLSLLCVWFSIKAHKKYHIIGVTVIKSLSCNNLLAWILILVYFLVSPDEMLTEDAVTLLLLMLYTSL